jgi:putative ABC transport system permease protein
LIGTVVVYQQIQFMRKQSWESILINLVLPRPLVGIDSTFLQRITAFKQELQQIPSIQNITISTSAGEPVGWNAGGSWWEQDNSKQSNIA